MNYATSLTNNKDQRMDDADISQPRIEAELMIRLNAAQNHKPEAIATGQCLFCGRGPLPEKHRWCDRDCCRDWEKEQGARR
jgi:hypothetical protein